MGERLVSMHGIDFSFAEKDLRRPIGFRCSPMYMYEKELFVGQVKEPAASSRLVI